MNNGKARQNRTLKQKLMQFRTYYLVPTGVIILVIIVAVMILTRIFGARQENLLYAAVFDNTMDTAAKQTATEEILTALSSSRPEDGDYAVELDDSFSLSDGKDAERLLVLSSNHACDVLIGNLDLIRTFAGYGYLEDLDSVLPKDRQEAYTDSLVLLPGYLDDGSNAFEDTETGRGEEKHYGISLEGSRLLQSLGCDTEGVYAGIILECGHEDNAVWFIEKLMDGTDWE